MQQFTLTLFGGFHLADAEGKPLTPATRKAKALLAWLALNPAREHLREKLASMFWPNSDEAQARHSLRQTLVELHRIMPETAGVLHTTRETVLLDEQTLAVDALEFNAALAQGDEAALDHAIGLYQGELLEGCNPRSDIFDDWLTNYRNDYSVRAVATLQQRLADLLEQQDYQHAILFATRLLAIDPLQESAYRTLMQANAGLGDAAAALLWYQRCQRVLQHELGVAPSPETRTLHDRLTASRDTQHIQPPPPAPSPQCGCPRHEAHDPSKRVLCLLKTALQGIVCNGMGHSFLIRGGTRQQKSSLVDNILTLASLQRFSCQHHTLATPDSAGQHTHLPHQQGSEARPTLLLVEHIHRADRATLESLANLISAAGSSSTLLVMTSCMEGEPLDPIWRGAMRGAPLTTVDL